jgi:hypothetical protein
VSPKWPFVFEMTPERLAIIERVEREGTVRGLIQEGRELLERDGLSLGMHNARLDAIEVALDARLRCEHCLTQDHASCSQRRAGLRQSCCCTRSYEELRAIREGMSA